MDLLNLQTYVFSMRLCVFIQELKIGRQRKKTFFGIT
jgi:hypothetical protein